MWAYTYERQDMDNILLIGRDVQKVKLNVAKYKTIYCFESEKVLIKPGKANNIVVIPEDFYTAIDFLTANLRASIQIDKIFDLMVANRDVAAFNFLVNKTKYAEILIKNALVTEVARVFRLFLFAEKVITHYEIKSEIDFILGNIPGALYKCLRANQFLPPNIKIPIRTVLQFTVWTMVKDGYFKLKLMFFPELLLLKMRGRRNREENKKQFKIGVHLHDGRGFDENRGSMSFVIDDKTIKREDALFVIDEKPGIADFIRKTKAEAAQKGYNLVNFHNDLIVNFNRFAYLKKYYFKACKIRFELLFLSLRLPILSQLCFYALNDYILWELFYDNYNVEKFFCIQHPGRPIRVFCVRNHGSQSILLHSSIVFGRLKRDKEPAKNKSEQTEYSFLVYDKSCSDKFTNQWLKTNQNDIKEFIDIGSVFSDLVYNIKHFRRKDLRKSIGVANSQTLITVFDSTVGHIGVLTFKEESILANSMLRLLNENSDYLLVFKFKKGTGIKQFPETSRLTKQFENLFRHPRCIYGNELELAHFELMGIADLIVTTPLSSVIFEGLVGGVKTFCYDPLGRYDQDHYVIENFPNFSAHSYDELNAYARYWLKELCENEFEEFKDKYIKKYVDGFCDGNAMQRFRDALLS